MILRPRGLFWTFSGVFLGVLVVTALLQASVSTSLLRPLERQRQRERAELALAHAADELAALRADAEDRDVVRILRANRAEQGTVLLAYRTPGGRCILERRLDGAFEQRIAALLEAGGTDARGASLVVLGRRAVAGGAGAPAEVVALDLAPDPPLWTLPESRAVLVSLPFAVLASGIAGLLMVRLLVRRLRTLERLAARVAEGDLSVRVEDPGADEVARLGARLDRMTETLAAARSTLRETDRQRRTLLADIGHELATPLTSIRGYVETMLDPAVPLTADERAGYLRDVLEESQRLDLLIGDLLDLARLESGTQALVFERLDWAALCRNTVRRFEARFRDAGLALEWDGIETGAWVNGDGRRLEQVAENLLVNALRYVPAGGAVSVSLVRDGAAAGGRFRFRVADDGHGIDPADLPHLFERFYRAAAVRSSSGSGLGLAIVREIVRRHDGDTRASQVDPHGAEFTVELPAAGA